MVNNSLNEWKNPVYDFDGDDEMIFGDCTGGAELLTETNSVTDKAIEHFVNHNRPLVKYLYFAVARLWAILTDWQPTPGPAIF
jgi:hypothetical protein